MTEAIHPHEVYHTFLKNETPRLVIMHNVSPDGKTTQFQWGIVGAIPIMEIIGALNCAKNYFLGHESWRLNECPQSALVVAKSPETQEIKYFAGRDLPYESTLGMIDMVKATLIDTHRARSMAAQQVILGPDGQPANRQKKIIH